MDQALQHYSTRPDSRFDTYLPCAALRPYIRTFVISEASDESTYKVLPDTGLVIGFQYKGKLSRLDNGRQTLLLPSGLTGLDDTYRVFRNSPHIGTLLVFFNDAAAAAFFRQPIHELFRKSVSLDHFMPRSELLLVEEQLGEAETDRERIRVVERFLLAKIRPAAPDRLVLGALALIHKHKGTIPIRELVGQLNTSQSPLEKRFRQVVGASPKKFSSIVRCKQAILQYNPHGSLTALGHEAGYYDQAHFIRAFKKFTGETPEAFFRRR